MQGLRRQGQAHAHAHAKRRMGAENGLLLRGPGLGPALEQPGGQPQLAHVVQQRARADLDQQVLVHARPVHEHKRREHHDGQPVLVFLVALADEPGHVFYGVRGLEKADGLAHELADLVEARAAQGVGQFFLEHALGQSDGAGVPNLGPLGQGNGFVEQKLAQGLAQVVVVMALLALVDVDRGHAHGPQPRQLLGGEGRAARGVEDQSAALAHVDGKTPLAPGPQGQGLYGQVGFELLRGNGLLGRGSVLRHRTVSPGPGSFRGRRISTTSSS